MKVLVQEISEGFIDQPEFYTFGGEKELTQALCKEIMEAHFGHDAPDVELVFQIDGCVAVLQAPADACWQIIKLLD